jgi:hypothetical protein
MDTTANNSLKESLEAHQPGATVIPVIVSTDKTLLTQFRDRTAYPIYMTIGNIPKAIRRKPTHHAQVLIGYIPTTKLEGVSNKTSRRRALANLFHACMDHTLGPIKSYGETGVAMMSGDGVWRRCHPIFSVFVGDYPEQALVACTYNGRCPKCTVPRGQLGEYEMFTPRDQSIALNTFSLANSDICGFHSLCRESGLKPVYHPFWEALPLSDIFISITPDILHQMLQGMMKHLIRWVIKIFGAAEVDARCRVIPPNHRTMLFTKGISSLSRVSGQEHKKMCAILLGLIVDLPIPGGRDPSRILKAVRSLLDFLYLAQYQCHTSESITQLESSLAAFHEFKEVFIDLGTREHFNIPKLHSLSHYSSSIQLFSTTDNYNTEQSERLHIDLTKNAYRATNRKDEYVQMTTWLERREKLQQHVAFVNWKQQNDVQEPRSQMHAGPPRARTLSLKMALHPSRKAVSWDDLDRRYGAVEFQDALADFLAEVNNPGLSRRDLRRHAANILIPFCAVPVFHHIKFTDGGTDGRTETVDSIHARPEQRDPRGRIIPSRFDTAAVVQSGPQHGTPAQGIKGES